PSCGAHQPRPAGDAPRRRLLLLPALPWRPQQPGALGPVPGARGAHAHAWLGLRAVGRGPSAAFLRVPAGVAGTRGRSPDGERDGRTCSFSDGREREGESMSRAILGGAGRPVGFLALMVRLAPARWAL